MKAKDWVEWGLYKKEVSTNQAVHKPLQQHLQRLKSQYHEQSLSLYPTHLSSPMMAIT